MQVRAARAWGGDAGASELCISYIFLSWNCRSDLPPKELNVTLSHRQSFSQASF